MTEELKPITVLSLFDGISCGQLALQRAGIPVKKYYASEIDKYAIQITQKNFPDTIQLGDITKIDFTQFIGKIDLIMGGSPCQDLSIAGKRKGLQGERSGLFYKFVEAIEVIKPQYYFLENNVGMPDEAYEEISWLMGCYPIEINSALVSAQTRKRFYWFNFGFMQYDLFNMPTVDIPQPEDRGILLKDILESGVGLQKNKSYCLTARYNGATFPHDYEYSQRTMVADSVLYQLPHGYNDGGGKKNKSPAITKSSWENNNLLITKSEERKYEKSAVYSVKDKSICINANGGGQGGKLYKIDLPDGEYIIRKLSPVECERLQTLPDNYTDCVSNTQRYKSIGNGWTVNVIAYIFKFLKETIIINKKTRKTRK